MKTIPLPNAGKNTAAAQSPDRKRTIDARRKQGEIRWIPPPIRHQHPPSLAADFERLSPANRPTYRAIETKIVEAPGISPGEIRSWIPWGRVFALAVMIAIIAALVANA